MNAHDASHDVTTGKYLVGFVLAVILTLLSFIPVMQGWLDGWSISAKVGYLLGLAIIQMAVQILFFLHLNQGPDAKWNLGALLFGVFCVFVIIFGTWWTMQHLNYRMMGGSGRVQETQMIYPTEPGTAGFRQAAPAVAE